MTYTFYRVFKFFVKMAVTSLEIIQKSSSIYGHFDCFLYCGFGGKIALPFVYTLLKQEIACHKVLQVAISLAERSGIRIRHTQTEFELQMINAAKKVFSANIISLCLFHLCQLIHRHV